MDKAILKKQNFKTQLQIFAVFTLFLIASCKTNTALVIAPKTQANYAKEDGIACTYMRGGTSKGPFFDMRDLPSDVKERNQILLKVMGSPDARQIDGLGGTVTVTSKVVLVKPSSRKWAA